MTFCKSKFTLLSSRDKSWYKLCSKCIEFFQPKIHQPRFKHVCKILSLNENFIKIEKNPISTDQSITSRTFNLFNGPNFSSQHPIIIPNQHNRPADRIPKNVQFRWSIGEAWTFRAQEESPAGKSRNHHPHPHPGTSCFCLRNAFAGHGEVVALL